MLRTVFLSGALSAVLCLAATAPQAQPTEDEIAAARLEYIDGDYAAALEVLMPAAEAGDANAQNIVADAYDKGNGVEQDTAKALEWWEKSAAQDFDRALHNLGHHYAASDPATSAGYYERAAALGYHHSMVNLGRLYEKGLLGDEPDLERAAELYEQASDLGNALAMNNLGRLYVIEDGLGPDYPYALGLFYDAAEAGSVRGVSNLGAMYANGYGVTYDPMAAIALYRMAAEQGHAQAAANLAYWLIEWDFGWTNPAEGWAWCQVAIEQAEPADLAGFEADCDYLSEFVDDAAMAAAAEIKPGLLR
ncbi:tetratricopeptide repeat protein [Psychromarinibacter halotolerans]|uniref:Tetratricopeptide repeat protein n=1 Tax=Psychromarinibacter halotolerans TaxID=1775175 RepID=A0ABV7GTR1_9RHOB|nr:tetratricopeptide repeat protein [Psychromarinibacter halotolerans]MDF0594774.1 tetratricopeptide repeat protein [Psychromarinibacter halotolerans]